MSWNSSTVTGNNSCALFINGPFLRLADMFSVAPSFVVAPTPYGYHTYSADAPSIIGKFTLDYVKIKLCVTQVGETGTLRLVVAKPKKPGGPISYPTSYLPAQNNTVYAATMGQLFDPLIPIDSLDTPLNSDQYRIFEDRIVKYRQNTNSANTSTKTFSWFFPVNRCYKCRTGNPSSSSTGQDANWVSVLENPSAYTQLIISTDDQTSGEGEYFYFRMWIEWCWSELD